MIGNIKTFRFWCQKVIPLVYDNSLSYYEVLCKVVHYLNGVIEDINEIPEYIDEKIKEAINDEHLRELIGEVFRTLEDAISNNNEEDNTHFSKDYPTLGTLLWHDNKLYQTIRVIDEGDAIIPDVNIELVDFGDMFNDFITEVKRNFTEYDDGKRETASMDRPVHQLVWLDNILYEVSKPINEGNAYIYEGDNTNVVPITMNNLYQYILGLIAQEILDRETADGILQDNIDAEALTREQEDARIELELTNLITSKISIVEGELAEEAQIRLETDDLLSSRLDVEIADRQEAIRLLQGALDDEAGARAAGDNALNARINQIVAGEYKNNFANVKALGAKGDNTLHPLSEYYESLADARVDYPFVNSLNVSIDYAAIQKAVNNNRMVYIPSGNYIVNYPIILTRGTYRIVGDAKDTTWIKGAINTLDIITFTRTNASCSLNVEQLTFSVTSTSFTNVRAIYFHGLIDGTTRYEDNWLTVNDCEFYDLWRCFDLYTCSNVYVNRCRSTRCQVFAHLTRAASFVHFSKCLALLGQYMFYCDDTNADGVSNGLYFDECIGVFQTGVTFRILGWQLVELYKCSGDLNSSTDGAAYIRDCQDVMINGCWFASDVVNSYASLRLWDCYRTHIQNCTISNGYRGLHINAPQSAAITVMNNSLVGNEWDMSIVGGTGITIIGNTFQAANHRNISGSETDKNVCIGNMFVSNTWSLNSDLGANSVIANNMFNWT